MTYRTLQSLFGQIIPFYVKNDNYLYFLNYLQLMTKVFSLSKSVIDRNVENKSGVYQIRCYNKGKPLVIRRLCNKDKLGILYIGSRIHINRRLKEFIKGINNESREHPSGYRYYILELDKKRFLEKDNLMFSLQYCDDYKEEEARLLMGYTDYFGELPPLNSQDINEDYENLKLRKYKKEFNW